MKISEEKEVTRTHEEKEVMKTHQKKGVVNALKHVLNAPDENNMVNAMAI